MWMIDPACEPLPATHPLVRHLVAVAAEDPGRTHRDWEPSDGPLPVMYISHGAPPLFEDLPWMARLREWARGLPRPRGILIVSAHWETAPIALSSPAASTPLVYDFGGFDPAYFRIRYGTPDASALAALVNGTLGAADRPVATGRGLDHGAWVPLKAMYPGAEVPVLQLSLPTQDPDSLMTLGARLRPLREEGILVIGSGFMVHGLPFLTRENWAANAEPDWGRDFDAWAADALARGDVDTLLRFRDSAPGMPYAHPTVEHFTPLFVTLGAATDPTAPVTTRIEGRMVGLSRRSFEAA